MAFVPLGSRLRPTTAGLSSSGTSFAVIVFFPPASISKSSVKNSNPSFCTFKRCLPGSTEIVIGPFSPFAGDLDLAFFVQHLHFGVGLIDGYDERAVFGLQLDHQDRPARSARPGCRRRSAAAFCCPCPLLARTAVFAALR